MNRREYNAFCRSLKATSHVVQWGGAHVWKVGDKVFAIAGFDHGDEPHITFKVSDIGYEVLKEQAGLRPAPYLASRGIGPERMLAKGYGREKIGDDCPEIECKAQNRRVAVNVLVSKSVDGL